MHHAAQEVMEKHNGLFPTVYSELISLKGVGKYTAAAISSISASEKKAVVDGNVHLTVLSGKISQEVQDENDSHADE